jgi:hypothetical protein
MKQYKLSLEHDGIRRCKGPLITSEGDTPEEALHNAKIPGLKHVLYGRHAIDDKKGRVQGMALVDVYGGSSIYYKKYYYEEVTNDEV